MSVPGAGGSLTALLMPAKSPGSLLQSPALPRFSGGSGAACRSLLWWGSPRGVCGSRGQQLEGASPRVSIVTLGCFLAHAMPCSSFSPSPAADETFSFKYSPGKLRGNQYKSMMTKEELEEEQRYVELPSSPRPTWSAPS